MIQIHHHACPRLLLPGDCSPSPTVLPAPPSCHSRNPPPVMPAVLSGNPSFFLSPHNAQRGRHLQPNQRRPGLCPCPRMPALTKIPLSCPAAPPPFFIPLTPTLSRREREKEKYPQPVLPILTVLPLPPVLRLLLSGDCSPSPTVLPAPPSCPARNPPPVIPAVLSGNPSSFLPPHNAERGRYLNRTTTPCSLPVPPNARPHENPTVMPTAPLPFFIPLTPTLSRREREKDPPPVIPIPTAPRLFLSGGGRDQPVE